MREGTGTFDDKVVEIEIALEEVLVNIINYAYLDEIGDVKISCKVDDERRFVIELEDTEVVTECILFFPE